MSPRTEQIISVIGTQFLQSIADLLGRLSARPYHPSDRVSSNYYEGGYSASIILLVAATLESLVQRDRYFYREANPGSCPASAVSAYTKSVLRYRRHAQVAEVFEVRNAIAHNHIWEIDFSHPSKGGRRHKGSKAVPGTHRLQVLPPPSIRIPRTNRLKLNLVPVRLDRTDVEKVMSAAVHLLEHLAKRGTRAIPTSGDVVMFRDKRVRFDALMAESKNVP